MPATSKNPHEGHRGRLRRRFKRAGLNGLEDYEQIELFLTYAIPRRDVKPLAKQLIEKYGSLEKLLEAPPEELLEQPGLGKAAVTLLTLIKQLCAEYLKQKASNDSYSYDNPDKIVEFLRMRLGGEQKEIFVVLFLNPQNHLIDSVEFTGTVDRGVIYAREVLEKAITAKATAVIIAHNHPSGACEPSSADIAVTNVIRQALQPVGIKFYDHIIIGDNCYFSFAARKML